MITTENVLGVNCGLSSLSAEPYRFDPFSPIPVEEGSNARQSQRLRRSHIYASIRTLLAHGGREKVTVRNIASTSGYAVQTVYNLVGNRNEAISEAIAEYKLFVGLSSVPDLEDPKAFPNIVNSWFQAVRERPDLQREANLLYFTEPRAIYYRIRDRQLREMRRFLIRQKNSGIIQNDADIETLCELLVQYSCISWLEWADRGHSLDALQHKIGTGFAYLLKDKITPEHRDFVTGMLAETSV